MVGSCKHGTPWGFSCGWCEVVERLDQIITLLRVQADETTVPIALPPGAMLKLMGVEIEGVDSNGAPTTKGSPS